jgi:DNA helicase II / ATP-dependent DNA helicase PcrA
MKNTNMNLSSEQKQAIRCVENPTIITGLAGTGKTTALGHKIAKLIENGLPSETILAFSVSERAGKELMAIAQQKSRKSVKSTFTTFGNFCLSFLREHIHTLKKDPNFSIINHEEELKIISGILSLNPKFKTNKEKPEDIIAAIKDLKRNTIECITEKTTTPCNEDFLIEIYNTYQKFLTTYNLLDIVDLAAYTITILLKEPKILKKYQKLYQYIFVDHYENITQAEHTICKLLSKLENISITIDLNQSTFKNPCCTNIHPLELFEATYKNSQTFELFHNHRLTGSSLETTENIQNYKYQTKNITTNTTGQAICYDLVYDEQEEADFITEEINFLLEHEQLSINDIGILYRVEDQRTAIIDNLEKNNIRYKYKNLNNLYSQPITQTIISFLRLINNPKDIIALLNILNNYNFGIKTSTVKNLLKSYIFDIIPKTTRINLETVKTPKTCQNKLNHLISILDNARTIHKKQNKPDLIQLIRIILSETKIVDLLESQNTLESIEQIETTEELISEITDANLNLQNLLDYCYFNLLSHNSLEIGKGVTLISIFEAKEYEFKAIFIPGFEEGLLPYYDCLFNQNYLEEEQNLFYISLSRASKRTYITSAITRTLFNKKWKNNISEFLKLIPKSQLACFNSARTSNSKKELIALIEKDYNLKFQIRTSETKQKDTSPTTIFKKGNIVEHTEWGQGKIISIEGKGENAIITISFDTDTKKVIAKYAPLTKI